MKLGIITDIHENVARLESALKLAGAEKCDDLICLGDITGYDKRFYSHSCRSARECVRLVRENFRWIAPGNHDLFASQRLPSYSDGFEYPANWFILPGDERRRLSDGKVWSFEGDIPSDLDEDGLIFLRSLPEYFIVSDKADNYLFSHYIYPDFTGSTTLYIKKGKDLDKLRGFMIEGNIKYSFSGHSHNTFPGFAYLINKPPGRAVFNIPSDRFRLTDELISVCLPPLTGETAAGSFAVFDTSNRMLRMLQVRGK